MFVGPDIRKLMKSKEFSESLSEAHLKAWNLMKQTFNDFLGKHRVENYAVIVHDLMNAFNVLGVRMSLKIHFMHFHLEVFARQMPSESDEQGERFHQTCRAMEDRYKNKNLQSFIADLCWFLTPNET